MEYYIWLSTRVIRKKGSETEDRDIHSTSFRSLLHILEQTISLRL